MVWFLVNLKKHVRFDHTLFSALYSALRIPLSIAQITKLTLPPKSLITKLIPLPIPKTILEMGLTWEVHIWGGAFLELNLFWGGASLVVVLINGLLQASYP